MLDSEVLYYPNFEPSKKWFRSYLLFFDTVCSIIPEDYDIELLSESTLELWDEIPDSFRPLSPSKKDIQIKRQNFKRLKRAFEQISNAEEFERNNTIEENSISDRVTIDHSFDEINYRGVTLLHNDKISGEVFNLLQDFNLIDYNSQKDCHPLRRDNFYTVNKRAADLIVSLVADNIANSKGFNTITDQPLSFIMNSLNSFSGTILGEPRNLLSYSLTNCVVPQNIENLSIDDYIYIHDKYKEIHEPFQEVISDLNRQYRLENVSDRSTLEVNINEITQNFNFEIEEIKRKSKLLQLNKFVPIGIGGLLTIIGTCTEDIRLGVATAIGSILIEVIASSRSKVLPEPRRKPVQRMIGNLQKDIINKSQVKALI